MAKYKVLFVCVHNSARSQMAEALLKKYGNEDFEVYSAGIEPGVLNPLVVKVLQEDENIDISNNKTKSAFDFVKEGKLFNFVVTVCDEASAQRCPIFPGVRQRIMMSFEDPSTLQGTDEEKIAKIKTIKDKIKQEVLQLKTLIQSETIKENFPEYWKLG